MSAAPARTSIAAPTIDILVKSALWQPEDQATVERAIAAAGAIVGAECPDHAETSVLLTDDNAIQELNRAWRGMDRPTNVLSFPAATAPPNGGQLSLGDIVIAYETTAREAALENKPFAHHLAHLAVHGFLHLLGYDHESDETAETMEQLERVILARLDVPDPYPRVHAS
jgi:probable rRNA maturation factor